MELNGGNKDIDTGTIENSTRGVLTMALKVDALVKPTHSGVGCLAPGPAQALAGLTSSLRDPRAISGFMGDCILATLQEIELINRSSISNDEYKKEHGVIEKAELRGDPQHSIYRQILEEPSIRIINMTCGKPDGGNSIQDSAECTIGVRLTAGQDPDKVEAVLRKHLESQKVLWDLPFTFKRAGLSAKAWKTDPSLPFASRFLSAMEKIYPKTAIMPTGETIPLFDDFQEYFPTLEMFIAGVEDPLTAAHSHNESQDKGVFRNAIDSLLAFFTAN